jgi:hydroxymethylglutaryl-CoA lyase
MALTNIYVALEEGVTTFDSSAGGLGGCPYAKGATGNVATEDVWYLLNSLGLETGVDISLLAKASKFILEKLGRSTDSKFLKAFYSTGKV